MPTAIAVDGVTKTFRSPRHRVSTFKERALHPFRRTAFDERHVLQGISFDVHAGEFFGIVGRNGSGKSTLLKCLAGIYRVNQGSIAVAGRLAPFIELGVGFNPDLTARDNVLINAVMMGLTPRHARERFDGIMAFAELEEFVDLKLKNYSSGMQVRLAFSVMVQADADVLLIDEVLAVGDAAFQQKCFDVFYRLRQEGKTIVLVTHEMGLVERFCHRAMLVSDGVVDFIGDPAETGRRYLAENFAGARGSGPPTARIADVWLADSEGNRVGAVLHGDSLRIHAAFDAQEGVKAPAIALWLHDEDGTRVFSFGAREDDGPLRDLERGERIEVVVIAENVLASGRYYVGCSVSRGTTGADILAFQERAADLVVWGGDGVHGLISIEHRVEVVRERVIT